MSEGKVTEIIGRESNNVTQRLMPKSQKTEIMHNTNNTNVTWVMNGELDEAGPVQVGSGMHISDYKIKDVISENTGEATLLLAEKDEKDYVIKLYHKNKTPKDILLDVLNSINTKYVVKSVEQGVYLGRFYEVLPYFTNGDLLSQMPISEEMLTKVIIPCVNEGLKALHDKEIIHRDIKPSNIFLSEDKSYAVIGDFGISSVLNQDVSVRATTMSRTLGYSAPETANGFISKESDYYSFGVTIYHLVLGVDPFAGMSDMQILYQTINKKFEIPQTIPNNLQNLIKGLTLKDRNDRWGYDEVYKWIRGEMVNVVDHSTQFNVKKPYVFLKNEYYDLESLSMAFAENWEGAKKHLYRGLVDKYLSTMNEDMASECIDLKEVQDRDLAVFKVIYLLNPNAPLCYKGKLYNDLSAVGDEMASKAPDMDQDISEMIMNGSLYYYLSNNHFDDKLLRSVYDAMHNSSYMKASNYFKLMYKFNPDIGLNVNGFQFEDLNDLIEYLEAIEDNLRNDVADNLVNNELFLSWVEALGYEKQVESWRKINKKVGW